MHVEICGIDRYGAQIDGSSPSSVLTSCSPNELILFGTALGTLKACTKELVIATLGDKDGVSAISTFVNVGRRILVVVAIIFAYAVVVLYFSLLVQSSALLVVLGRSPAVLGLLLRNKSSLLLLLKDSGGCFLIQAENFPTRSQLALILSTRIDRRPIRRLAHSLLGLFEDVVSADTDVIPVAFRKHVPDGLEVVLAA